MGKQRKELEEADNKILEAELAAIEAREKVEWYEELTITLISEKEHAIQEKEHAIQERDEAMESQGRFTRYPIQELLAATDNLADDAKIGEGSCGRVFKGQFHVTPVAIKVLNHNLFQGGSPFQRKMDRLSCIKHPRLVMLMGACPEVRYIVYEYMPGGSLEDRLLCKHGTPPLPWFDRLRIAAEVCEGLLFMHTIQPSPIVHHHVKPSNILLDNDLGSKISDFGLLQLLSDQSRAHDLTTNSNVYSFGILVLQLLIRKPANEAEEEFRHRVEAALASDYQFKHLLDEGGKWPPELGRQLATIALDCTVNKSLSQAMQSFKRILIVFPKPQPEPQFPDYFCCPITMEVMKDPYIAEDGYSYEFEEIKRWFDNKETSPMTGAKLKQKRRALVPNRSLRNAIENWRNQTGFSHPA